MRTFPRIIATALVSLVAASGFPQQQQQQKSETPKFVENIDVRVINVDVVVTDKKGNVVHGLKKDDF